MMSGTGGQLAIAHGTQFTCNRLATGYNTELFFYPSNQIAKAPSGDPIYGRVGAFIDKSRQRLTLLITE